MWLMVALCIGSAGGVFIQLRAQDLSCEDAALEQLLRTPNITLPPPPKHHYPDTFLFALENHEMLRAETRRSDRIVNHPTDRQFRDRVLDLMRHHIYETQKRLKHLDRVTNEFLNDVNYRMGFVYCRLETILVDMRITLTRQWRIIQDRSKPIRTNNQPFYDHLLIYTYMAKKNLDVIYIVEYLIRLHTATMSKRFPTAAPMATSNLPTRNAGAGRPGSGPKGPHNSGPMAPPGSGPMAPPGSGPGGPGPGGAEPGGPGPGGTGPGGPAPGGQGPGEPGPGGPAPGGPGPGGPAPGGPGPGGPAPEGPAGPVPGGPGGPGPGGAAPGGPAVKGLPPPGRRGS